MKLAVKKCYKMRRVNIEINSYPENVRSKILLFERSAGKVKKKLQAKCCSKNFRVFTKCHRNIFGNLKKTLTHVIIVQITVTKLMT